MGLKGLLGSMGARIAASLGAMCVAVLLAGSGCAPEQREDVGEDGDVEDPIPESSCGDGIVDGVESCEPPTRGCNDACQLSGEVVQVGEYEWHCEPTDVEVLAGSDPIVPCDGTRSSSVVSTPSARSCGVTSGSR